jgi:hypothetical protein
MEGQVLRLEFTSLDEAKFRRWLVNWGGGIVTNGAATLLMSKGYTLRQ